MCQCPRLGRDRLAAVVDESNSRPSSNRGVLVPQIMEERVQQRTVQQIIDVTVPQVMKEIMQVAQFTLHERMSERIIEQIVDVPVQNLEEIVELVRLTSAAADRRTSVDELNPQILKVIVEVVEFVPQGWICFVGRDESADLSAVTARQM